MKGRFIVIEGGEGVGKTTQVKILLEKLQSMGRTAEFVREPGGEPMAEEIRELLLDKDLDRTPETELFMFNAARIQTLHKVQDLLDRGTDVLSDRSYLSSLAYQGHGHQMDLEFVRAVCDLAIHSSKPDLIILLTAPASVVNARRDDRGVTDRFENMDENFHERVRTGYVEEAERLDLPIVDASPGINQITDEIWKHVEPLLQGAK
jgi:dTMP kinase